MKEHPILFSGPMVRALLDGCKTQTRRAMKPQPTEFVGGPGVTLRDGSPAPLVPLDDSVEPYGREIVCPYGQPGDRLWVREAHAVDGKKVFFRAGHEESEGAGPRVDIRWRPSIHMPRWASRITLEVTTVRVERLQDISEADAIAEGCTQNHNGYYWGGPHPVSGLKQLATAKGAYQDLWESINGPDSWAANPWVWAIEFRRLP